MENQAAHGPAEEPAQQHQFWKPGRIKCLRLFAQVDDHVDGHAVVKMRNGGQRAHAAAGRIDLDAPLTTLLPDFRQYNIDNWERKITFRQCLGHQTPFPGVFPLYTYGSDPNLLRAFVLQHEWPAGPAV